MQKRLEIHPALGVCRVGPSREFFLGPESGSRPSKYRDSQGNLLRQGCRFRVFLCERDTRGKLLSWEEVTPDKGSITWSVHLANRKAAAPYFLDRTTNSHNTNPEFRRNRARGVSAADAPLIIDAGEQHIAGISAGPLILDAGKFQNVVVPLGELRTDEQGALIVVGASGKSGSIPAQGLPNAPTIEDFADNNGWYDDIADGPIRAVVKLKGDTKPRTAASAWAISAPPDFAPEVFNLITLYDAAHQVAINRGWLQVPEVPSFARHIQPILSRAIGYAAVNRYNHAGHAGRGKANFALDWARLADAKRFGDSPQIILDRLRDSTQNPVPPPKVRDRRQWMPRLHDETNSEQVLPLLPMQYAILKKWAAGQFVNDFAAQPAREDGPDWLDRVTMEACAGGPLFPGIEVGRIIRDPQIYVAPFRIDDRLEPGTLTQGNGVPWQADFYQCRWEGHDYLGWWPAQRPDQVLPEESATVHLEWQRGISGEVGEDGMISAWHRLGIVVRRGDQFIETERTL